jgi:hypothetical protein
MCQRWAINHTIMIHTAYAHLGSPLFGPGFLHIQRESELVWVYYTGIQHPAQADSKRGRGRGGSIWGAERPRSAFDFVPDFAIMTRRVVACRFSVDAKCRLGRCHMEFKEFASILAVVYVRICTARERTELGRPSRCRGLQITSQVRTYVPESTDSHRKCQPPISAVSAHIQRPRLAPRPHAPMREFQTPPIGEPSKVTLQSG